MPHLFRWQTAYLRVNRILPPLGIIAWVLLSALCGMAQVADSDTRDNYKTVDLFDHQIETIIPKKFRKLRNKKLQDSIPFTVTDRVGFHHQNASLKFFTTSNEFPGDDEIAIWDMFDKLIVLYESHVWMRSGYTIVNNQSGEQSTPLYFVIVKYVNSNEQTGYALINCLEVNGRVLIALFEMPDPKPLEQFQNDFAEAVRLHN